MANKSKFTDEQCMEFSNLVRHNLRTIKELSEEHKICYGSMANYVRRGDRLIHDEFVEKRRLMYDVCMKLAPNYEYYTCKYLRNDAFRMERTLRPILDNEMTNDQLKRSDVKDLFEAIIMEIDLSVWFFSKRLNWDADTALFIMWFQLTRGRSDI